MVDQQFRPLAEALERIRARGLPGGLPERLYASEATINAQLRDAVIGEIPAFSTSGNPAVVPELAEHGAAHTREIIRLFSGGAVSDFRFVHDHSQRRAEQRFPLEATLHAYRCGHRVFVRWLRKIVIADDASANTRDQLNEAITDFTIEYTDAVSTVATASYVSHTRLLADLAIDQRAELLNILLEGYDESDGRASKILRNGGYLDRRQSFCVALARAVDPAEMRHLARARRLADSIDAEFRDSAITRLVDLRNNQVVMIFSAHRRASGWTAPTTSLASRVIERLNRLGNSVLVGVSNDVPSTSQIPIAVRQAELSLEIANVTTRVQPFSSVSLRRALLHLALDGLQRILPAWTDAFCDADDKARHRLSATLRAYAQTNMNVLSTAARLSVHANTVYARFEKITSVSGLDPKSFDDLSTLLVVVDWREVNGR